MVVPPTEAQPVSPPTDGSVNGLANPGLSAGAAGAADEMRAPIRQDRCGRVRVRAMGEGLMTARTQEMLGIQADPPGISRQELLVAADRSGHYTSIGDALRRATPGALVRVRPGIYRESLVIDRPVELLADGPAGSVVVESSTGSCLLACSSSTVVSGFTFRCAAGAMGLECFGVEIQSRLFLHECDITSNSLACVAVRGPGADPIVRRCRIHHGAQTGILFYQAGRGTTEDCEIVDNARAAVEVQGGSDPTVRRCRISGAVSVFDRGRGTFEECDLRDSAGSGLAVESGGDPLVRHCSIHGHRASGVLVAAYGRGTFEECNIFGNALAGVEIKSAGNPVVRRCGIRDGRQGGVTIYQYGRGILEECEISGNALSGIEVKEGADPLVRRCGVHDNQGCGMTVTSHGHGIFEECEIFANQLSGVEISSSADPVVRRCRIHHGRQGGVLVHTQGLGTIDECDIYADARCGMALWEDCAPLVRRSKIHECRDAGLIMFNGGRGTVEQCEFWGHNGKNLDIRAGCEILHRDIIER